jgi:hypothetical protein
MRHESLHAYHFNQANRGRYWFDSDGDELIVSNAGSGSQNRYSKFIWDHRNRGFINYVGPSSGSLVQPMSWLNDWGDSKRNDVYKGFFAMRLDNKLRYLDLYNIFSEMSTRPPATPILSLPTIIPADFPSRIIRANVISVCLYNPAAGVAIKLGGYFSGGAPLSPVVLDLPSPRKRVSMNGEYSSQEFNMRLYRINYPPALSLITSQGWQLYAIFGISYKGIHPYEFDASSYGCTGDDVFR